MNQKKYLIIKVDIMWPNMWSLMSEKHNIASISAFWLSLYSHKAS